MSCSSLATVSENSSSTSVQCKQRDGARDLKHDAGPVDGVYGPEAILLLETEVGKEVLRRI